MTANGELVFDSSTGQSQYRFPQYNSGLLHVQSHRRPENSGMRGDSLQCPPLHHIHEARLQPQVDAQYVYSSAGVDSTVWVKENGASDASKARTCGPESFPQSYGEGTHFAPSQPSLPSTSSLQHTPTSPFNTQNVNYSSLPAQSYPRGFGQGTFGHNNVVLNTTTSVEGNGAGATYHYGPRYRNSGEYPQAIVYQGQQCEPLGTAHVQYNTFEDCTRAPESHYYQAPSRGASNVPRPSSGTSQYMVRAERQTTPDIPHMPMPEVQSQAAVAPHPADAYQHFTPVVTTRNTHYAIELNGGTMNSQTTSVVPTSDDHYIQEQNHCAFPPPDPGANEWTTEELPARSKETNDYVVYDAVANNERTPSATEDLSRVDVSTLVPITMACMSVYDLMKALDQHSAVHPSLALHSVYTMAETMLMSGWTKASLREQMVGWAAQLGQVTGQQVPLIPASLTNQIFICNLNGCGRTFSSKGALAKHQRYTSVHSNGATFFCSNCDASFLRSDSLKRHKANGQCMESG